MARVLPTITYKRKKYYVDFRLAELRSIWTGKSVKFTKISGGKHSRIKKKLREIRFRTWGQEYIRGIDD